MSKKVTAGYDQLGQFAPAFAKVNDDVLFGQIWSRTNELSARDRSLITISALMATGAFEQLGVHLNRAKENGVTRTEIAEVITHLAFYVGWPKAWSTFGMAKEIFASDDEAADSPLGTLFETGDPNPYGEFFTGNSYLNPLLFDQEMGVSMANVTFEPAARNHWHIHENGYQLLIVTGGEGWYQEEGKEAKSLSKGDVILTKEGIKHWHGAKSDQWFEHVAITFGQAKWFEPVDESIYEGLDSGG